MKKRNWKYIFLPLASVISVASLPLISFSCSDIWGTPKPPSPTPKPNPNNPIDPNHPQEPDPMKKGYTLWKSGNVDFAKKNNNYFFKKLSYESRRFGTDVYNDKKWLEYIPKLFVTEANSMNFDFEKWNLTEKDVTTEFTTAANIWQILRQFSEFNNGILPFGSEDAIETYKRFIKEMQDFIGPINGVNMLHYLNDANLTTDYQKNRRDHLIHYGPTNYGLTNQNTWNDEADAFVESVKEANRGKIDSDKFLNAVINQIWPQMKDSESWSDIDNEPFKNFYLPFTLNSEYMYLSKNTIKYDEDDPNSDLVYFTWNPILLYYWQTYRFTRLETMQKVMYYQMLNFYSSLTKLNGENKKWSEIASEKLEDVKKEMDLLTQHICKYLNYKMFVGCEWEDISNKKQTLTHLFPWISPDYKGELWQDGTSDFEYSWVWAYNFLYDVIIPFYQASNLELPQEIKHFDLDLTSGKSHKIYQFAAQYLNTIFEKKVINLDYNHQHISQQFEDESGKKANKAKWLNFIKNWNGKLGMGVDITEL